ncbi:MAG: hypothetical protein Q9195_007363 [Heterodermia aff. obscurata]
MTSSKRKPRDVDSDDREAVPESKRARLHEKQSPNTKSKENEELELLPKPPDRGVRKLVNNSKLSRIVMQHFAPNEYQHVPLSEKREDDQIRLLILHPGKKGEDSIQCSFHVASLSEVPEYEALSYYWGTEPETCEIRIRNLKSEKHSTRAKKLSDPWRKVKERIKLERFHVRPNLHAALSQLREQNRNLVLWVDALCINQEDVIEKTQQVQQMARIYSKAHRVLVWLGAGNKKCEEALGFIDNILDLKSFDTMATDEKSPPKWAALVELMRCDWFSRRWVIQELALAKDATLHYNDQIVKWKDFADAVAIFATRFDAIKQLFLPSREFNHNVETLGDVQTLGANILVDVTANHFRRSLGAKDDVERLSSLENLASRLLKFEASDPRDTVYAILSICKSNNGSESQRYSHHTTLQVPRTIEPEAVLVPDYRKSMIEVYRDFTKYCVATSGSIDIICRHWAPAGLSDSATVGVRILRKRKREKPKVNAKMPSWVPQLKDSPFGGPRQVPPGRVNGDSLVGLPDRKCYNACGGRDPQVRFENIPLGPTVSEPQSPPRILNMTRSLEDSQSQGGAEMVLPNATDISILPPSSSSSTSSTDSYQTSKSEPIRDQDHEIPPINVYFMFVTGIQLDTVTEVTARIPPGFLTQESLKMGGWNGPDGPKQDEVPDELWRTLVADRAPDGGNPPGWYHRACLDCFRLGSSSGDVNMNSLITNPETASLIVEFLKRVQGIVWNRLFIRSQEKKLFGLGPKGTQVGDLICILYGCSVPVILRPQRESLSDKIMHYEIVGESYIYGMMDGEAFFKARPEINKQEFKLG